MARETADPYERMLAPVKNLRAAIRTPSGEEKADKIQRIVEFIRGWDTSDLGALEDAVAVIARRSQISFRPDDHLIALVRYVALDEDSPRTTRDASEWAKVIRMALSQKLAPEKVASYIKLTRGIDAAVKKGSLSTKRIKWRVKFKKRNSNNR